MNIQKHIAHFSLAFCLLVNASSSNAWVIHIFANSFNQDPVEQYLLEYYGTAPIPGHHHHACFKWNGGGSAPAAEFRCLIYYNPTSWVVAHDFYLHCDIPAGLLNPSYGPTLTEAVPTCPGYISSEKNLGASALASQCDTCVSNPINQATGNKFQTESDYLGSGPFPLEFKRYYNSDSSAITTNLGHKWSSSYGRSIYAIDSREKQLVRADGRIYTFRYYNFVWNSDPDVPITLMPLVDGQHVTIGFRVTLTDDSVEEYDLDGRLVSITHRDGLSQTLEYALPTSESGDDNPDTLDRVTGPFGRHLSFSYDTYGRVATLADPAGNIYRYTYAVNGNLESVAYPDATPENSLDNPVRTYHYEDLNFANALTGITDENGNRFATWAYDAEGRTILSEHAGGAERVELVFNPDGTTTVTSAQGQVQTYQFHVNHGLAQIKQMAGGPCSGCGENSQTLTYDAKGFIASRTDFNGNVTTYVHDARGLETSRTEAAGSSVARTITTTWHPGYRLPLTITEPGKRTSFTYDSQGRLLERIEEALP